MEARQRVHPRLLDVLLGLVRRVDGVPETTCSGSSTSAPDPLGVCSVFGLTLRMKLSSLFVTRLPPSCFTIVATSSPDFASTPACWRVGQPRPC